MEMWGITDPFLSRSPTCSPTHWMSSLHLPLPSSSGCRVEVTTGSWACSKCSRKKAQEGTSFVLPRAFTSVHDNNFYIFHLSQMCCLHLQVMKSIFVWNDKGIHWFIPCLLCCKSLCKVAGKQNQREYFGVQFIGKQYVFLCILGMS